MYLGVPHDRGWSHPQGSGVKALAGCDLRKGGEDRLRAQLAGISITLIDLG